MKVGMITTWRVPCGVAKYTEKLCDKLSKLVDLKVYAEVVHQQSHEDPKIAENPIPYVRCWKRGEPLDKLYYSIVDDLPNIVHIQFESAMYNENMFAPKTYLTKLLDKLHKAGIKTVLTLHNVPAFNPTVLYGGWYEHVNSHFIVTNKLMEKELKKWYKDAKITVIPLGSTIFQPTDKYVARKKLELPQQKYIILQFGFYGYDKGMLPLIEAVPTILKDIPDAILVFAGSIHPLAPQIHKDYLHKCIQTAYKLRLQGKVMFTGRFLTEEETNLWLSASDIIAINHQYVFGLYSSSASAHRVLCSNVPIIMNSQDVRLSEFQDKVNCLKATNTELATKIVELSRDQELQRKIVSGALKYAYQTSFKSIAESHLGVYKKVGR